MKRDMDLVRELLLKIEELPFDNSFHDVAVDGRSPDEISYHVMLLAEAKLIEAKDFSNLLEVSWKPMRLTYTGHEFLDAARNDTVWQKAKAIAVRSTGVLTLEGLKVALPMVIKNLLSV